MPRVKEMLGNDEPDYPSTGCKQCDGIRKLKRNPALRCLMHDETIPEEERNRIGVRFERLVKGIHRQEK